MTQDLPPTDDPSQDDKSHRAHPPGAVDTLKQAMRRARVDNAERASVISDLRGTSMVRLEMLQEALQPLAAQIPPDVDMFDIAILPGANPRLFIEMIGFVEMARDTRVYRLLQDTRNGRIKIAQSANLDEMVDAVTNYVARRLLERDKALAADVGSRPQPSEQAEPEQKLARVVPPQATNSAVSGAERRPASRLGRWLGIAFAFVIDLLGSVAFFSILAALAWYLWHRQHTPS